MDIAIIGAGPVGGALACWLATAGWRVALVDRVALPPMEHPDFDGRAYAIARGSRALLDAAGLWERLPFAPCPIRDIHVTDGKPGHPASPLRLQFDHRATRDESGSAQPFGWIIEARALRMAINRRLREIDGVWLYAPAETLVRREADRVSVQIQDGPVLTARLAIAADGRNSRLREEANIPVTRFPYRQSAVVCALAHERPHDNVALEHFLPGGPFAQLPMTGSLETPNVSAIVFTDRHEVAQRLAALDAAAFTAEVAKRLGGHLGAVRLVGKRWSYPLSALHAHRYTAPRLALVGDSAHGIHPIAGQGLNLGLRDAEALARLIVAADDPGDPFLLARYQRARRPDNLLMLAATDALDRLFSNDIAPLRLARDIGLAVVNRLPRLKGAFMRTAMGLDA